ncbi:hypothetical protein FRC17_011074 [Serendipita sp. 399]|nr:hypothetical protein FRC17_011074 [Serendipita sp. 399]
MIITDDSSDRPSSPALTKTSQSAPTDNGLPGPSEAPGERHQPSPLDLRAAPPSYSVATSTSGGQPSPRSPMIPRRYQLIHPQAMAQNYQDYTLLATVEQQEREISRRTRKRFGKALLVALLCYFLLTMFFGSLFETTVIKGPNDFPFPPQSPPSAPHSTPSSPHGPDAPFPRFPAPDEPSRPVKNKPWPSRLDGEVVKCYGEDSWSPDPKASLPSININEIIISTGDEDDDDFPYIGYNTFTIPLDAKKLSLFSKGRHSSGGVTIRAVETQDEDANMIKVAIRVSYRFDQALQLLNICQLKDKDTSWRGLGIYTTGDFDYRENVRLHIDFMFPKTTSSTPLQIEHFTSTLAQFAHSVFTGEDVHFDRFTLSTSNARIQSSGLVADNVVAVSSNSAITGTYNVSGPLVLSTSNAKIQVDLNAFHREGGVKPDATLSTKNGGIDLRAGLYHVDDHFGSLPDGGRYKITASTSNAHVNVTFLDAPVDSILETTISTSNGHIETRLHPAYEGDVALVTSNAPLEVHEDETVKDPSGRGRKRIGIWNSRWNNFISGWVGWGEKKAHAGSVKASTSNGRNVLYF